MDGPLTFFYYMVAFGTGCLYLAACLLFVLLTYAALIGWLKATPAQDTSRRGDA
jgi:hypothetical protein